MNLSVELVITIISILVTLFLLIFAVNWRFFRDWIVVFLYKCVLDSIWGTAVVVTNRLEYPYRQFPHYFKMSIMFEYWVFPVLCVLYNQVTRKRGLWPIIYYAALFSAGMTAIEYPIEIYTDLITYIKWSWFTTFITLTLTFLSSRLFIAFYRWGCGYFSQEYR